jgi:hypothetical protein
MHEDNKSVVAVLNHLTARPPAVMDELRKLWELIDTNNINIRARYIRSAAKVWVDRLSRETNIDDWQLNPRILTYMDSLWGPHSIDKFATQDNSQLPRYNSRWRDPTSEAVDCLHIFSTACGRRRPIGATHLGRSFPTSSESYANLAPKQQSSRSTGPPKSGTNY